jgi:hypothetical protein
MPAPFLTPHNAQATHCIVAFAHASDPACTAALRALPGHALPHLHRVLQWSTSGLQGGDGHSLNMPHEHALAQALGWPQDDGYLPWAAWESGTREVGCAWLWPCHWQASLDHVMVQPTPPNQIDQQTAEALLSALRPLAEEDGLQLSIDTPNRWLAQGPALAQLRSVSLDRVAQRRVDAWQLRAETAAERTLLRLQNEAQMLFYNHHIYDERAQQGLSPINGFWISGAGALPADDQGRGTPRLNLALRETAQHGDWAGWLQAWHTLDAEVLAPLVAQAQAGAEVRVTLCGEASWQTFIHTPLAQPPTSLWQKVSGLWRQPRRASAASVLETLSPCN